MARALIAEPQIVLADEPTGALDSRSSDGLLALLMLTNEALFIGCTVVCFVVFALVYAAIYGVTARSYYKIVSTTE